MRVPRPTWAEAGGRHAPAPLSRAVCAVVETPTVLRAVGVLLLPASTVLIRGLRQDRRAATASITGRRPGNRGYVRVGRGSHGPEADDDPDTCSAGPHAA